MATHQLVYFTLSTLAGNAQVNRTTANDFLVAWTNLVVSELNAGRAFAIPTIGRLSPRKTFRTNMTNPRTAAPLGTRLKRAVYLIPAQRLKDALI